MTTEEDAASADDLLEELWRVFVDPPDDARPRAWWHWMDGNIDPAGIQRDLAWLRGVGIRGVQLFDGGMGVPLVVPEPVRPGTPAWADAIDTAVRTADALDLELAVATSSGWSAAGGPWVVAADAMKKVVWSETVVDGGDPVRIELAPLPTVAGLYQDAPRWGGSDAAAFATDWVVLALPYDPAHDAFSPGSVSASAPIADWSCLTDGSFEDSMALPRNPDAESTAWVEQVFDEPVTVRSVVVGLPGPRGFGAAPQATAVLQAADDEGAYRHVVTLEPTSVPARSASFAPVTARRFRLVLSGAAAAQALPPMADGVRIPPVLRRSDAFLVSEFALRGAGRVHSAETKAGFGVVPDYYAVETDTRADAGAIAPDAVIDLTGRVSDGILNWNAPAGRWRVLRLGASLTGQTNGPAPADSTGLEVDKLDGERVAAYLETHLGRFGDGSDPRAPSRFGALLSDSIEAGPQNWTDRILEHFADLRGYDPLRRLPALAGYLVGDAGETDRFLFDYRRTLAELLAREYYGTLADQAHRRGMTAYAEALEDGRPQLGDDLAMRSHSDVPMGAMWTFDPAVGPRPTYVADLKGAASVAHVYGKAWTGSEAFTSFGDPWIWTPQSLKHIADLQLCLGVTRFCIHTSAHQPVAAPPPGIALAPFLGQAFTVHETWAGMARPWIDYLARCSALLSAGRPAVDFAVFVGEEAPVTGLFDGGFDESVPAGFDFDYVGADALNEILHVADGRIRSMGADYRLLLLGGSSRRMTVAALASIEALLDAGATVVGRRPESSPSLVDDPTEFGALCDRIWAAGRTAGHVVDGDLGEAIRELGLRPALAIDGGPIRRISRWVDGRLLTFVANPRAESLTMRVTPATKSGVLSGWDPVRSECVALGHDPSSPGSFTVTLAPFGSLFVIADERSDAAPAYLRVPLDGEWRLDLPGAEQVVASPHPERWTDLPVGRGFSGTGTYTHDFVLPDLAERDARVSIEFASVDDIARVLVNGQDCGIVWTPPFRLDISPAVRPGANHMEVQVANPWRNRLVAEAGSPTGEIFAPMTAVFETTAAVRPAGVCGAVSLLVERSEA